MFAPLRPSTPAGETSGPESPEALVISSLLESQSFRPEVYNLAEEDLSCWSKLWNFAIDHQVQTNRAPALEVVKARFPDFEYTPKVDTAWAVNLLRRAASSRALRKRIKTAVLALDDQDLETAYAAFDNLGRPRGFRHQATSIFDHTTVAESWDAHRIEVPYPSLGRVSGGIGTGELWVLVARLSMGKSWQLAYYAAHAAIAGYRVRYLSLEMSDRALSNRVQSILAARSNNRTVKAGINSDDPAKRKQALDQLRELTMGSVEVVDPSRGRFSSSSIAASMDEVDLVVIDHLGLMRTDEGRRAVDDWRAMAMISNSLKEDVLASGVPVLAAAQANREADSAGARPPKLSQISQADAIGQDADVVISMKRLSTSVLVHSAEKVRSGPQARWYTNFDPAQARFEEVSRERAEELQSLDDDRDISS